MWHDWHSVIREPLRQVILVVFLVHWWGCPFSTENVVEQQDVSRKYVKYFQLDLYPRNVMDIRSVEYPLCVHNPERRLCDGMACCRPLNEICNWKHNGKGEHETSEHHSWPVIVWITSTWGGVWPLTTRSADIIIQVPYRSLSWIFSGWYVLQLSHQIKYRLCLDDRLKLLSSEKNKLSSCRSICDVNDTISNELCIDLRTMGHTRQIFRRIVLPVENAWLQFF